MLDLENALTRKFALFLLVVSMLLAACGQDAAATPSTGDVAPVGTGGPGPTTVPITPQETQAGTDGGTDEAPASETETMPATDGTVTSGPGALPGATGTTGATRQIKVALMLNGTLGDKGFFDSAKAGVDRAEKELGAEVVQVVEEPDRSNWEPTLRQLADSEADVIVLGTFDMSDALNAVAPEYEDKTFIFFDATVDQPNVANIVYSQNEGSFLAGVLASCATQSDLENLSGKKVVGVVGGSNIPVINDFIVGYEQGAKYFNKDTRVLKSYNSGPQAFEDPAKGKELALAQFDQGANVVFNVAGKTGLGVLEAAADEGRYSIGVDQNQNNLHPGSVLSSMLKRVDNSVFDLLQMEATGGLTTGKTYPYGIQNEGVGLAEDQLYEQHVPQECKDQVEQAKADILSKQVVVETALK